jgi:hypothetical protein
VKSTPKAGVPANKATAAPKAPLPDQANVDPFKYYDAFFAKEKFENPDAAEKLLLAAVLDFFKAKKYNFAEAILKGFLNHHGKDAEAWMYVFLAECIHARKGNDQEMKQTLSYAAHLAKRTQDPRDLIRVADMMVLRKFYGKVGTPPYETNIGELIDMASDKVPTNAWPVLMSVSLANHDKDPIRMADAAERLLSNGWPGEPGFDDRVRRDLKGQVNLLAEVLKIDGRVEEAEILKAHLAESESRDIYMKLTWKGDADIDLTVAEPLGATANYTNFRTVFGGAIIQNGYGKHPEEIYVAPRAFDGDYVVNVEKVVDYDSSKPVLEATLDVYLFEGSDKETHQTYKINIAKPEPIIVKLPSGTGRRKKALPYIAPAPLPVVVRTPIDTPTDQEKDKDVKKKAAQKKAATPGAR